MRDRESRGAVGREEPCGDAQAARARPVQVAAGHDEDAAAWARIASLIESAKLKRRRPLLVDWRQRPSCPPCLTSGSDLSA